jgi:parallel beta-helix repeat protein
MSRIGIVLVLISVSVLIASASAADPVATATTVPAPDLATPGSAALDPAPRGVVASLPVVITTPGTYTLDRDYLNLGVALAIDVRCSNVVIDGGGHIVDGLDGANSAGVQVHGAAALSGVTVKNLRVSDWAQGVYFWNARGRIEGVIASSNTGVGILLYSGADGTVVTGCTAKSNSVGGLSVSFSPGVEISSSTFENNGDDGVYVFASDGARITGVTSTGNTLSGIALLGSGSDRLSGAVVSGCRVASNGKAGIYMFRAEANTVTNNRFENARNVFLEGSEIGSNTWNAPKTAGTNIVGGPHLGGNWWSGFSETAADANGDGLADLAYAISAGNSDALPLVPAQDSFAIRPGMVITVPGTYTLGADILDTEHRVIVEIRCSNVVIEGNGHRISGNGAEYWCGIFVNNPSGAATGITIRDLTVANCYYGLYLVNTDASRIEHCRIADAPLNGMRLILSQGSDGNTITGNRILAGPTAGSGTIGIAMSSSSQNTLTNNEVSAPLTVVFGGTFGPNTWNGAKTPGVNIMGGPYLGGNYWGRPDGTGWSQQAPDTDHDGIGDGSCALAAGNTDSVPLVKPRPSAGFTATTAVGSTPLPVQFADTSGGSPTSWAWSFGDGGTSTLQHPSHTYTTAGTYTVSLTVSNASGERDTETRAGLITVWALTVSSIAPNTGVQGSAVAVTNLAGTGFRAGATVRLVRTGSPDVTATNVVAVSPTRITCDFALPSTAATGAWSVVVTNRDGRSATLPGAFTVSQISPPPTSVTYAGQKVVISQAGSYALTNDITNSNLPVCVEIRASDVVFDGLGHLIDGVDAQNSAGIYVHGASPISNVTVRNVRMQDWWYGVYLHGAQNSRVETSTLSSNGFTGFIAYSNAAGNRITGSTITGNDYGIVFSSGSANGMVLGNEISQNSCGTRVYLSDGITIAGNRIMNNINSGLQVYVSGGGTIYNNRLSNLNNVLFTGEPFKVNEWSVGPFPDWTPANIIGGPRVGGNFWGAPDSTGFSQINPDADGDGFIDLPLQIAEGNFDYHPLAVYTDPEGPVVLTIPGGSGLPTAVGGSVYNDINGNGRKDFSDVVLYFNQMTWIAANEPTSAFDYNGNGRIDFADTVWLFNHL